MQKFSHQDIVDYYDQTEEHYRMWWKMEKSMGLHYGVWDENTKTLDQSVINLNKQLSNLVEIGSGSKVLDAGCGVGGSSFYLAKQFDCATTGITLSEKQVNTATKFAKDLGLENNCKFRQCSYTETPFENGSFDFCWAIESFGSAIKKEDFFKEMHRILNTQGKILIADTFKSFPFPIEEHTDMQQMLNPWAISDILSKQELVEMANQFGFHLITERDVTAQIRKSVDRMYYASIAGMIGTKIYNFFKDASRFSKIHYKSGLAQKKTYKEGKWKYLLFAFEKV